MHMALVTNQAILHSHLCKSPCMRPPRARPHKRRLKPHWRCLGPWFGLPAVSSEIDLRVFIRRLLFFWETNGARQNYGAMTSGSIQSASLHRTNTSRPVLPESSGPKSEKAAGPLSQDFQREYGSHNRDPNGNQNPSCCPLSQSSFK